MRPSFAAVARMDAEGRRHCPKCDGIDFQPGRSTGMKVGLGLLSLAAQPNEIRCITCGARYSASPAPTKAPPPPAGATPPRPDP